MLIYYIKSPHTASIDSTDPSVHIQLQSIPQTASNFDRSLLRFHNRFHLQLHRFLLRSIPQSIPSTVTLIPSSIDSIYFFDRFN
ncbi:hypothetical protein L6452_18930 [Arctium lappa]|uniref:Uncharacterized protein n=1 Tax=Arctium lappa TaxID=4217 RepID=A0ACB9B6M3_ARCLA|nr:hypothetical protein L6452_18930 [Arctium lappa]